MHLSLDCSKWGLRPSLMIYTHVASVATNFNYRELYYQQVTKTKPLSLNTSIWTKIWCGLSHKTQNTKQNQTKQIKCESFARQMDKWGNCSARSLNLWLFAYSHSWRKPNVTRETTTKKTKKSVNTAAAIPSRQLRLSFEFCFCFCVCVGIVSLKSLALK